MTNRKPLPTVICAYCNKPAALVTGKDLYPHLPELYHKMMWKCQPCKAWVGCHPGTIKPLGRLADADLRKAKAAVHALFDPLWRSKELTGTQAYRWLGEALDIPPKETHVGMFDLETCRKAIEALKKRKEICQQPQA